ncbi:MAG: magnesium transporter CorA family protein, partial [Anaerolineales bacterium]
MKSSAGAGPDYSRISLPSGTCRPVIEALHFPAPGRAAARVPPESLARLLEERRGFVWVDLERPTAEERAILSDVFHLHPMAIEASEAPRHHPKIELYGDTLFLIVHGILPESSHREFRTRVVGLFLGPGFLISYRREKLPALDAIKEHQRNHPDFPLEGPDFLLHRILSGLVEMYLPVLDL